MTNYKILNNPFVAITSFAVIGAIVGVLMMKFTGSNFIIFYALSFGIFGRYLKQVDGVISGGLNGLTSGAFGGMIHALFVVFSTGTFLPSAVFGGAIGGAAGMGILGLIIGLERRDN